MWENVVENIPLLKELLSCPICHGLMENPHTILDCDHHFCMNCIASVLEDQAQCPICQIPTWNNRLHRNLQLGGMVNAVYSLIQLTQTALKGNKIDDHSSQSSTGIITSSDANLTASISIDSAAVHNANSKTNERTTRSRAGKRPAESSPIASGKMKLESERILRKDKSNYSNSSLFVMYMSGMGSQQKALVEEYVTELRSLKSHSVILRSGNVASDITHLIVSANENELCARTLKYMLSILRGIWIVSDQWIHECFRKKQWISEASFEVKGDTSMGVANTPKRARESTEKCLLRDIVFFIHGQFDHPSSEELCLLIREGGGCVLSAQTYSQLEKLVCSNAKTLICLCDPTCQNDWAQSVLKRRNISGGKLALRDIPYTAQENEILSRIYVKRIDWLLDSISLYNIVIK